jgi:hypothetical protein
MCQYQEDQTCDAPKDLFGLGEPRGTRLVWLQADGRSGSPKAVEATGEPEYGKGKWIGAFDGEGRKTEMQQGRTSKQDKNNESHNARATEIRSEHTGERWWVGLLGNQGLKPKTYIRYRSS